MRGPSPRAIHLALAVALGAAVSTGPAGAQSESEAHRKGPSQTVGEPQKTFEEPALDSAKQPESTPRGQMPGERSERTGSAAGPADPTDREPGQAIEGDTLIGRAVVGNDGKAFGEITDVVVGKDGRIEAALVEVGGILGLGGKTVALPIVRLRIDGDRAAAELTREQAEKLPEYAAPRRR